MECYCPISGRRYNTDWSYKGWDNISLGISTNALQLKYLYEYKCLKQV